MAAETGAVGNIQTLLQFQADLLARDSNGCTALDLADKAQHIDCCSVLKHAAGEYLWLVYTVCTALMCRENVHKTSLFSPYYRILYVMLSWWHCSIQVLNHYVIMFN